MFHFGKSITDFGFRRFLASAFICVRHNSSVDLEFRMTGVEDRHLKLAAISFQVEVNNSFIFLPLNSYKKKISKISVDAESIIPCHV